MRKTAMLPLWLLAAAGLAGASCGYAQHSAPASAAEQQTTAPLADPWGGCPYMGDYQGSAKDSSPVAAQVIALGGGKYQANLIAAFDQRAEPLASAEGSLQQDKVVFETADLSAVIASGRFTGEKKGGQSWSFEMKKVERLSPTLGAKPAAGAVVLFDGTSLENWQKENGQPAEWKLTAEGAMEVTPKSGNIESKKPFGDCKIHLEFRTPFEPHERGQKRGNSGVYVQGCYEVQVLDSYGLEGVDNECGGIYKVSRPRVNMCAPPNQWQTYDIVFRAPRFDDKGQKTANARISVKHNGVAIHEDQELPSPTGGAKSKEEKPANVLLLQNHSNPVQFRNIWVEELSQN